MIRTLIVDDEPHAREELASLLAEQGDLEVIGGCGNAMEAIRVINHEHPQVLFLDIRMPVLDGFELLGMIEEEVMPFVVFVTAYDEYALKAFEEKTLDYLLKPVDPQRLDQTLKKIRTAVDDDRVPRYQVDNLQRIPCSSGHKIKLIDPREVEYVHSDLSGVHIHTEEGGFFTELTLKVLEARGGFYRSHKQYLFNPHAVDEIIPLDNGQAEILTRGRARVPVSRRYLRRIKSLFNL